MRSSVCAADLLRVLATIFMLITIRAINYSKINSSMCIKQYIQVLKNDFFFFRNISEENQETDTGLTNTNTSTRKRERTSFLKKMEPLRFCS